MTRLGIVEDYRRYRAEGNATAARVLLCQGFWAICEYRVAHAVTRIRTRALRSLLTKCCVLSQKLIQIVTGIHLPRTCHIGRSLYIPHAGPVFVSEAACIGDSCTLHPGVVIGAAGRGDRRGSPRIGDRVFLGVHAVVLGGIRVGSDSAIGAGAVVTHDIPPESVVVGNPARCISSNGSRGLITKATAS